MEVAPETFRSDPRVRVPTGTAGGLPPRSESCVAVSSTRATVATKRRQRVRGRGIEPRNNQRGTRSASLAKVTTTPARRARHRARGLGRQARPGSKVTAHEQGVARELGRSDRLRGEELGDVCRLLDEERVGRARSERARGDEKSERRIRALKQGNQPKGPCGAKDGARAWNRWRER